MGRLGDSLDALRAEHGSPDEVQREAELAALVSHLTTSEVRALRLRLNAIILPNDLCTRFPLEIIQSIARYLDLEEIIRARHVSRSWSHAFGGRDTSVEALKWHFPLIWERDFKYLTKEEQVSDKMEPDKLLMTEARRLIRRKRGQYHSMDIYRLPLDVHHQHYCNGRLAFKKHNYHQGITVWSLRSDVSSFYVDENREPTYAWELSESLLVCEKRNRSVLLVWHLDAPPNDPPMTIHLPNRLQRLSAYHEQVAVITNTSNVMMWTWGGILRVIDTSAIICESLAVRIEDVDIRRVVFHPLNPDTIFLTLSTSGELVIAEHRFTDKQWRLISTYQLSQLGVFDSFQSLNIARLDDGNIGIHGYNTREKVEWERRENESGWSCPYILVTFNVLTKTFKQQKYSILNGALLGSWIEFDDDRDSGLEVHFWRDQLLASIYELPTSAEFRPEGVTNTILAAFDKSENSNIRNMRWYGQTREDNRAIAMPRDPDMKESALAYFWIGGNKFAEEAREAREEERRHGSNLVDYRYLQGDDDFVVQLGINGFVVWCFDERVTLRKSGSSSDPNLPPNLPHPFFA